MEKPAYYILTYFLAGLSAIGFLYFKRRNKKTKFSTLLRVLFNPKIWLSASSLVDFGYLFAGLLIFPTIFLYTVVSGTWLSKQTDALLNYVFGTRQPVHSEFFYVASMALAIYVTYEFAYWLNHYLSHRLRFLWEFHKVHHAAKVLTPVTVWRVHLVDTMVFANMTVAAIGLSQGAIAYIFGHEISAAAATGSNVLLYGFMSLYGHLQHSQIWIPFTGAIGHVFFSPAHHQIHHSNNPAHFNKNFGSSLAVFDWMFGSLHMPAKIDEKLTLGVDKDEYAGRFIESTLHPFMHAWRYLRRAPEPMSESVI